MIKLLIRENVDLEVFLTNFILKLQ